MRRTIIKLIMSGGQILYLENLESPGVDSQRENQSAVADVVSAFMNWSILPTRVQFIDAISVIAMEPAY